MSKYNIPYEFHPAPNLICAGTPSREQFQTLAGDGVTTVVSVRNPDEYHGRDVPGEVKSAGMEYVCIPLSSPEDFTPEAAKQLKDAIDDADGKVLVFCGTSNRVGGLLAIKSHLFDNMSIDDAIAFGEAAGLAKLKPTIIDILKRLDA